MISPYGRLKAVKASNGGKYTCNNVEDIDHELTVVDPDSMECPTYEQFNVGKRHRWVTG